jgi:hypothetical protein
MEVKVTNNFVLNPDRYFSPAFRISPFQTQDIHLFSGDTSLDISKDFLRQKIYSKDFRVAKSGKSAINLALTALNLSPKDCVTILTTSGNKYIAKCVTDEIEKFCRWSRGIEKNSAAILVNHEFGYPYRNLRSLKSYNLPIIEDACHSFLSNSDENNMGLIGDFIIFSLPKIFSIQMGGLIYYDSEKYILDNQAIATEEEYILDVLSQQISSLKYFRSKRLANYNELVERFKEFNFTPFFKKLEGDVPGVFLFNTTQGLDIETMKKFVWQHGIECSIFYGRNAFFLPCHHNLSSQDLEYFTFIIREFLRQQ